MTLFDFINTLKQFSNAKKYDELLAFFKQNKETIGLETIKSTKQVLAPMLNALGHSINPENGLHFMDQFGYTINAETDHFTLTQYIWLLHYILKNELKHLNFPDEEEEDIEEDETYGNVQVLKRPDLIHRIETLLPLYEQGKNKFLDNAFFSLFNSFFKLEKKRPTKNWKLLEALSRKIDPQHLSLDCFTTKKMNKGVLKDVEAASHKESWYAIRTKALFELNRFEECLQLSEEALEAFPKFHYQNDVWLARKIALSRKALGQTDEAINSLKKILQRKPEWFILKELAEILFEKNELDQSFQYACNGMVSFGDLEYKVDLLKLLGKILQRKQEPEKAFLHFLLLKKIREGNGWRISPELQQELNNEWMATHASKSIAELVKELRQIWSQEPAVFNRTHPKTNHSPNHASTDQIHKGLVIKILHQNERGINGFLRDTATQTQYYFAIPAHHPMANTLQLQTKLSFGLKVMSDGKINAINLKPIN